MSSPVTLVAWEDATKKPPGHGNPVMVDFGEPPHSSRPHTGYRSYCSGVWGTWVDGEHKPTYPQPVRWFDPPPPGPDALTVGDLQHIDEVLDLVGNPELARPDEDWGPLARVLSRRLRAALDALGNGGDT